MKDGERLALGLAWFSLGLGAAQLLAPKALAKLIGVRNHKAMPLIGARELGAGFGMMADTREPGWAWARVAGDAMDLGLLSTALKNNPHRGRVIAAMAAVAGVAALDYLCATKLSDPQTGEGVRPAKKLNEAWMAVTIDRPAEELYNFWKNFENLPRFMDHLESVEVMPDGRSHWRVKAPMGRHVEWDAFVEEDVPNERITWRSVEGSQIETVGTVSFEPAHGGRGTVVRVRMTYHPPGGALGVLAAKLTNENPDRQIYEDLRAFKQLMELGEVVLSEGTLNRGGLQQRPGRPPKPEELPNIRPTGEEFHAAEQIEGRAS